MAEIPTFIFKTQTSEERRNRFQGKKSGDFSCLTEQMLSRFWCKELWCERYDCGDRTGDWAILHREDNLALVVGGCAPRYRTESSPINPTQANPIQPKRGCIPLLQMSASCLRRWESLQKPHIWIPVCMGMTDLPSYRMRYLQFRDSPPKRIGNRDRQSILGFGQNGISQ